MEEKHYIFPLPQFIKRLDGNGLVQGRIEAEESPLERKRDNHYTFPLQQIIEHLVGKRFVHWKREGRRDSHFEKERAARES